MTDEEAGSKAESMGLMAVRDWGYCVLYPAAGGYFVGRGQTWEDAFARYTPLEPRPEYPSDDKGQLLLW